MALPDRASPDLGLRHVVGADPARHQRRTASAIKAVALPSKQAFLYVFDRITGQPVWPIEERPVPQSDVPGEKTSPTQPFPTKPPAYARNYLKVPDDLIDFTPELRAQALEIVEALQASGRDVQPAGARQRRTARSARSTIGNAGGGTNWPGVGVDPETHIVYAQASNVGVTSRSARRAAAGLLRHPLRVRASAGQPFREVMGPGDCCAADAPQRARRKRAGAARGAARRRAAAPARRRRRGGAACGGGGGGGLTVAGPADRQAAVRRAHRDQSRPRRDHVAGAARRHAGQRPQSSGAARA